MNQSDKAVLVVRSKNEKNEKNGKKVNLEEAEAAVEARQARSIEFCNETSKALFEHDFAQI